MDKTIIGIALLALVGCTATKLTAPPEAALITLKSTTGIIEPDLSKAYSKFNDCLSAIDLTQSVLIVNGQILKCREAFHASVNQ